MDERIYNPQKVDINELKGRSGVYQIRNIINNHVYIGSSRDLHHRLTGHFKRLCNGKHINHHLQNAFNKYGQDNFTFEIVEFCNPDVRFDLEQYWIDKFYGDECYNLNEHASCPPDMTGIKRTFSEEHKRNISLSAKRRCADPEYRKWASECRKGRNMGADHINSLPVVCLETGKVYAAISEAKREIPNGQRSSISACCRNRGMTSNGLHWMFKEDYDKLSKEEVAHIIFTKNRSKQVVCLETRKVYGQMIKAQADTGIGRDGIRACCNGKIPTTRDTHWVWYEDYLKLSEKDIKLILSKKLDKPKQWIPCRCITTGEIFDNIQAAARRFGLRPGRIKAVCDGRLPDINGYQFEFVN